MQWGARLYKFSPFGLQHPLGFNLLVSESLVQWSATTPGVAAVDVHHFNEGLNFYSNSQCIYV